MEGQRTWLAGGPMDGKTTIVPTPCPGQIAVCLRERVDDGWASVAHLYDMAEEFDGYRYVGVVG